MHGTLLQRPVTPADLDLMEWQAVFEARKSFWAFRRWMNPGMILGWWQYEVALELQRWYEDYKAGKRPYLVLSAPPQHGKSMQMVEFLAWLAGQDPDMRQIYASYGEDLGVRANKTMQLMIDSPRYKRVFPDTSLSREAVVTRANLFARNTSELAFVNKKGSFRNTTIGGAINGLGLDVGLIDDPMKGRLEAQSKPLRDKVWWWFTDDFFGRLSKNAGIIIIMTRWHVDDMVGRFKAKFPQARILNYEAIANKNEKYRRKGEALFDEHKPLDFLLERKGLLAQAGWESVYQGNPIVVGGGMFPIENFEVIPYAPARTDVVRTIRYWDKAGTDDGGAYTCGTLIHELKSKQFVISDVRRGQWGALKRETMIKNTAESDKAAWGIFTTWVEQEPGSGGKESAENTIRSLRGFVVRADKVTGAKEIRAEPYAAQVQGKNVKLVAAAWNQPFVDEHETFPGGKFKDQIDSAAGAFAKCTGKSYGNYDPTMAWVDNE
jgi:predicted phage terminase large subunit-like protein